jgi:hypothetical protein
MEDDPKVRSERALERVLAMLMTAAAGGNINVSYCMKVALGPNVPGDRAPPGYYGALEAIADDVYADLKRRYGDLLSPDQLDLIEKVWVSPFQQAFNAGVL